MNTIPPSSAAFRPGQHLQLPEASVHDPYLIKAKLNEPSVCPDCHAVYHKGRWQWGDAQSDAALSQCPACKRMAEQLPAGYITIQGPFSQAHREELLNLIRHFAEREKMEHPLKRIMHIDAPPDRLFITTTDIHLARGIGEALQKAFKGELEYHYNEGEYLLRLSWTR